MSLVLQISLFCALYLSLGALYFGQAISGYSHKRDTLSELGALGSVYQGPVSWGLFLPVGLCCLVLTLVFSTRSHALPAVLLSLALACGYLSAAAFPCDPGSPCSGSKRQQWHNLGGVLEYLGGASALGWQAWQQSMPVFACAAISILACTLAQMAPALADYRGLLQRVAESMLFIGLISLAAMA